MFSELNNEWKNENDVIIKWWKIPTTESEWIVVVSLLMGRSGSCHSDYFS